MSYPVPAASTERIGSRFIRAIGPLFRTLECFQTVGKNPSKREKNKLFYGNPPASIKAAS
ncbi:hypothetical protein V1279_002582 [Bradyrhizobium sp. AZCC 1610]